MRFSTNVDGKERKGAEQRKIRNVQIMSAVGVPALPCNIVAVRIQPVQAR